MKPRKRSWLRLKLGGLYFSFRRYLQWHFSGVGYARSKWEGSLETSPYSYLAVAHESLLLRKLKNVDMWLQHNKVRNLQIAIRQLDRLVIRPGEIMSFWKRVGSPSKQKGYLKGMELLEGDFRAAYGGGLCQLSNLIYWMTLHTPLTVTERYRHQYDVFPDSNRTLPFGSGATVAYNYIDLQIRNDTPYTFCLHLFLTDTHLAGEWCTDQPIPMRYEVFEKNHRITQEYWGGYVRHNQIWRRVYAGGSDLPQEELVTENHAFMMYSPLLPETANETDASETGR